MTPVEQVKSRLDIAEVIGEYLQLRQAGTSMRGLCPFHQEQTPSFFVSREKQVWHCFGCGEGGDMVSFVMKLEGMDFPEALKHLAQKAGIQLPTYEPKKESDRSRVLSVLEEATRFFESQLRESPAAEVAREYLKSRQLDDSTIEEFRLGFAPAEWDSLRNHLLKKGHAERDCIAAGLLVPRSGKSGSYDRFRGRIIFPVNDESGRVIGFSGRLLPGAEADPQAGGKYINTPQTSVYNKSEVLYGLDRAKMEIRRQDAAIVVEGNMDVISSHRIGVANVVAVSGTAFVNKSSEEIPWRFQLQRIKRFTQNVLLAFDADLAGESAAKRGIEIARNEKMNVSVFRIPEGAGKDPDDCIRKDPELWRLAIAAARPIEEFYFDHYFPNGGAGFTDSQRADAIRAFLQELEKTSDQLQRAQWVHRLSEFFGIREDFLYDALRGLDKRGKQPTSNQAQRPLAQKTRGERLAERTLAALLTAPPSEALAFAERVTPEMMEPQVLRTLYVELVSLSAEQGMVDDKTAATVYHMLRKRITDRHGELLASRLTALTMLGERDFKDLPQGEMRKEFVALARELRREWAERERERMEREMRTAEAKGDQAQMESLTTQFQELLHIRREM
ncbi:MAG: DNA primase [Patescibacteria group bacterium]